MRISRRRKHHKKPSKTRFRYNERIRLPELRVIDADGTHKGTMSREDALALARSQDLDLVEINPAARPPVAKVMEYGQFKYTQEKLEKQRKQKQKEMGQKGVRLSARIGQHDLNIRKESAIKFLDKGNNVKIEIILRGREKGHVDIAQDIIRTFINSVKEERAINIEQHAKRQGSKIIAIITPAQDAEEKKDQKEE